MLGLSDVNQTSRVRSLTARELPLAVEGYLVYCSIMDDEEEEIERNISNSKKWVDSISNSDERVDAKSEEKAYRDYVFRNEFETMKFFESENNSGTQQNQKISRINLDSRINSPIRINSLKRPTDNIPLTRPTENIPLTRRTDSEVLTRPTGSELLKHQRILSYSPDQQ